MNKKNNNIDIGENNNKKVVKEDNNFKLVITEIKLQDKIILLLKIYIIQVNGKILIRQD